VGAVESPPTALRHRFARAIFDEERAIFDKARVLA
jgi:hypothetical protein